MKQTHSRYFKRPARLALAGTCALVLGATTALAQATGASSSPSGTSSNTDRYGSGSSSTSATDAQSKSDRYNSAAAQTNASTSGAAAGSRSGTMSSDGQRQTDSTGSTYSSSTTPRTTDTSATASTGESRDRLPWGDRRFVTKASDRGMSEVELAKLASEKATNPEVRSYAQKIVQDHEKVNSELTTLAQQKNVKLDTDDAKDRTYRRLSNKSGHEFDEEFVEHMIEMHEDDVKMFEKAASDAKDTELRSFASKHVDHLREHLQQAQSLRQSIMPTGRTEDATRSSTDRANRRGSSTDTNRATDTSTFGTGTTGTGSNPTDSSTSSGSATSPRSGSSSSDTSTSGSSTPRGNR